ncbi:MAG TPA: GxxExxY protein [Saprospiraceae bacterium]|nr:GxxExxY protein [Saprospiraceae bacterium]
MKNIEMVARQIVDAAYFIHQELGPGLLESAYQFCLIKELKERGLELRAEVGVPLVFKGEKLDCGYRLDILVEQQIILEIKSVETLLPIHTAQLITYLKLTELKLGFLINFNTQYFKSGIRRIAYNL